MLTSAWLLFMPISILFSRGDGWSLGAQSVHGAWLGQAEGADGAGRVCAWVCTHARQGGAVTRSGG